MVFGILSAVAAAPAIVGTTEAIRLGQRKNQREEHRGRKNNLSVTLLRRSPRRIQFDGALIVLKDNKLYVDARKDAPGNKRYHPFTSYYLAWPHGDTAEEWKKLGYSRGEGYVTTINDENFLNWVYVDRETHEVKYGVRAEAEPHKVGPWDCTKVERRLTFEGWEGDDGLRREGQPGSHGKMILQLEVWRKEMRRERYDAVHERFERLDLREEQEEKTQTREPITVAADFESRLQLQRDVAKQTQTTDFEKKLQQQRELGKNIFTK